MLKKGNWPDHSFTKWEKLYIARRVLEEHAGVDTYILPSISFFRPQPRPKKDMPVRYTTSYLDEFASYIINRGMNEQ